MAIKILSVDDEQDLEVLLTHYFRRKIRKGESYFKYEVDVHYHYSAREAVFDTDVTFMDKVENFYESALKGEL